jgi:hypothetical protein
MDIWFEARELETGNTEYVVSESIGAIVFDVRCV